jgi:hypothetical protein
LNLSNNANTVDLGTAAGTAGISSVFGGTGADSFTAAGLASYYIDGGTTGTDTLNVTAAVTGAHGFSSLASVEVLNLSNNANTVDLTGAENVGISTIIGGNGADAIDASSYLTNSVYIDGGSGADALTGGAGNDSLTGGSGVDSFQVYADVDTVTDLGDGGNDQIDVTAGATANVTVTAAYTAQANSSNANILNATASDALAANTLVSFVGLTGNGVNLVGNNNGLLLTGSAQDDTITGGTSNDSITGGNGVDTITGDDHCVIPRTSRSHR